jgi:hypothetical protein
MHISKSQHVLESIFAPIIEAASTAEAARIVERPED